MPLTLNRSHHFEKKQRYYLTQPTTSPHFDHVTFIMEHCHKTKPSDLGRGAGAGTSSSSTAHYWISVRTKYAYQNYMDTPIDANDLQQKNKRIIEEGLAGAPVKAKPSDPWRFTSTKLTQQQALHFASYLQNINAITNAELKPLQQALRNPNDYYEAHKTYDTVRADSAIIQQIKHDIAILTQGLTALHDNNATASYMGRRLHGKECDLAKKNGRQLQQAQIDKLNTLLAAHIIPSSYTSLTTKQTLKATAEELALSKANLKPAKHTFFVKKVSRKDERDLSHSIFAVSPANSAAIKLNFFAEHNPEKAYPSGGFAAKVKKGYTSEPNTAPNLAMKVFKQGKFNGNTQHELRIAMRAAYVYRQLGRTGYAFRRNNKQYLVSNWLHGTDLSRADQTAVQSMPIAQRITLAIHLLRELNVIHTLGLIHHDIKPSNVRVNYGQIGLTDLDSVMLKGALPHTGSTPMHTKGYLPGEQLAWNAEHNPLEFCRQADESVDIYAMGITLTHLFQEIYLAKANSTQLAIKDTSPVEYFVYPSFNFIRGPKYSEHPALQRLLKRTLCSDDSRFKSVQNIIAAFETVLATYSDHARYRDQDRLRNMDMSTINPGEGRRAFKEIEMELATYNQRQDMRTHPMLIPIPGRGSSDDESKQDNNMAATTTVPSPG